MGTLNGPCVKCGKTTGWGVANGNHREDFLTTFPVDGERLFKHKVCPTTRGA